VRASDARRSRRAEFLLFFELAIQQGAKTKLSQSSVTMHPILAQLLKDWRSESTFAQESDFVFASVKILRSQASLRVDGGGELSATSSRTRRSD
jgi:hypothetical protein